MGTHGPAPHGRLYLSFFDRRFSCEGLRDGGPCMALKSCTVPLRPWILMAAVVFHNGKAAAAAVSETIAKQMYTPSHPSFCCRRPRG